MALPSYGVGSSVIWLSASRHPWVIMVGGAHETELQLVSAAKQGYVLPPA